jgi:hypothetical protein
MIMKRTSMKIAANIGLAAVGLAALLGAASVSAAEDPLADAPASIRPPAGAPYIGGAWIMPKRPVMLKTIDGKDPPLLPAAKAEYAKRQAALKSNPKSDPIADCLPHGVPRILYNPYPVLIVQQRDQVDFVHEANHTYRIVDLTRGPPQLNDDTRTSTYLGYPSGKWEGKTLVVDTVGFNDKTWLDGAGLPHGEKLHVQERYALKDANTLEGKVTITDPDNYSAPWTTAFTLKKVPNYQPTQMVCVDDHKM